LHTNTIFNIIREARISQLTLPGRQVSWWCV